MRYKHNPSLSGLVATAVHIAYLDMPIEIGSLLLRVFDIKELTKSFETLFSRNPSLSNTWDFIDLSNDLLPDYSKGPYSLPERQLEDPLQ